jgi:hypothetical protein
MPAHRPAVVLSAGTFALVEAYDYPYRVGIQYRFAARGRWSPEPGLAVHHVSNGGLASPNNGTESLVVFIRYPLGRPPPSPRNP